MATMRPMIGLTSLLWLALNTAWAQDGVPANAPVLPPPVAEMQVPLGQFPQTQVPAAQFPQTRVRLYRLKYAQAGLLADELAAAVGRRDVRVVGDVRTNSVIVASSPAMQDTVASLIRRLDVPQAPGEAFADNNGYNGQAPMIGNAPVGGSPRQVAVQAIAQLLSDKKALEPGSQIAVLKLSPATANALEAVMQPQAGQPGLVLPQAGQQAQEYQAFKPVLDGASSGAAQFPSDQVKTLRLSHDDVTTLARALSSLSAQGPGAVVVLPSETPATGSRSSNMSR